jgi:C4-dicarboxylate-specific signal transduction histidine kinase
VLFLHHTAFVLLVGVTAGLGIMATLFWRGATTELLELNNMLQTAQHIRGDIFRQIREISTLQLMQDPSATDNYWKQFYEIDQSFYDLDLQVREGAEREALDIMRHAYETMQSEMNKHFAVSNPQLSGLREHIEKVYQQHILTNFELAFQLLTQGLQQRRLELETRLRQWTDLAPLVAILPVALALGLLIYTRRLLYRHFVVAMGEVIAGAQRISTGRMDQRVPEQGVEEVALLATSMNRMADALSESREALVTSERQAALGSLVPVVAHNIRNPLASIRSAAQVLDYVGNAEEHGETKQAIIDTVDRLERWVTALLNYLNPLRAVKQVIPLANVVEQALTAVAPRLVEKQQQIRRLEWDESLTVKGDATLLEQALYGLLINAAEASPVNGILRLSLLREADQALLCLDDEGPGMPFEPTPTDLTPGPTTKRFGTGLGIPFAFKICRGHEGSLSFMKLPTTGTRVCCRLPLFEPPGEQQGLSSNTDNPTDPT